MLLSDLEHGPAPRICRNCGPMPDDAFGIDLVRNGHHYQRALCRGCHNALQQDDRQTRARERARICACCGRTDMKNIDRFEEIEVCRRCRHALTHLAELGRDALLAEIERVRLHLVAYTVAETTWHNDKRMTKRQRVQMGGEEALCRFPSHARCVEVLTYQRVVLRFWDAHWGVAAVS